MADIVKLKLKKDEMGLLAVVSFYLIMCPYNKVLAGSNN